MFSLKEKLSFLSEEDINKVISILNSDSIFDDAYCLTHPHSNRLEEAVCSLYFQLHNAKALILKQERALAELKQGITFSYLDKRFSSKCNCSKCL